MELMAQIAHRAVRDSEIAIFWLGQAGFLIKDSQGRTVTIDPYLTDCCERVFGFKRLSPKLISPSELETDVLFSTHEHLDHFDIDAIPILMASGRTQLVGSPTSVSQCAKMGIAEDRLTALGEGDTLDLGWVKFTAVYADHGDLAPDAIGVLISISGVLIYYTGDTAYRPEKMSRAIAAKPDIVILPINGAYGNMDSRDAACLVRDTEAKYAIPCHYWTFAVHGGNPQEFDEVMKADVPGSRAVFLCQGEAFSCMGGSLPR
jgi:L-ascorbate 6-phosphate lactonase